MGSASDLGLAAEPALGDALEGLLVALGAEAGAVWIKEPTTGVLRRISWRGTNGPPGGEGARIGAAARPALYEALLDGRELIDGGGGGGGAELGPIGLTDGVLVPLRAGGETLGALGVAPAPAPGTDPLRVAARTAARVLALALRNAQLFAGLQERARELDRQVRQLMALTEVARGVARSLDPAAVQRTIVAEAHRLVWADVAALLTRAGEDDLVTVAAVGPALAPDAPPPSRAELAAFGALAEVPVLGPSGETVALIALARAHGRFGGDDLERLSGLAEQAAAALANAALLSDLRRERDERKALAAAMVQAQEQERQRVAEDLHDGPVQDLVGVSLLLDALARDLHGEDSVHASPAARAAGSARDAVRGLRQAILDLHPMALQELGLASATRAVVQRLSSQGVRVDLDLEEAEGLRLHHRTVAFRVLQEAVANAVRHAQPARVSIVAHRHGGDVVIEVTDDGHGFDPARTTTRVESGHLGLAAMRERAALAGGALEVSSVPGLGTTVRLALPEDPGDGV